LFEEIETFGTNISESFIDIAFAMFPLTVSIAARKFRPSTHGTLTGRSDQLEDTVTLINVGLALEDGLALEHFTENTAVTSINVSCVRQLRRP